MDGNRGMATLEALNSSCAEYLAKEGAVLTYCQVEEDPQHLDMLQLRMEVNAKLDIPYTRDRVQKAILEALDATRPGGIVCAVTLSLTYVVSGACDVLKFLVSFDSQGMVTRVKEEDPLLTRVREKMKAYGKVGDGYRSS